MIDYDAIRRPPVASQPFRYFAAAGVLSAVDLATITADFPQIVRAGLFPLSELSYGPAFQALVDEICGAELEDLIGQRLGMDLSSYPLMITVRGWAHKRDGRIHTDTESKVATGLLYLNGIWDESGGRLRMLRRKDDVTDFAAEIPPNGGTLVAYLRSDKSWHGHEPYEGPRRYVMFNWMSSRAAMERELGRHRMSAKVKRLNPFA